MALRVVTKPAKEPVTLAEAKAHLRVDANDDDTYISSLITSARMLLEELEWRTYITTTYEMTARKFATRIYLRRPPAQSVVSIQYIDANGVLQTLDASKYVLNANAVPAYIEPAYGEVWPTIRQGPEAVRIQYKAGYGDNESDVPEYTRQAILLLVGHWYRTREAVTERQAREVPFAVSQLLRPVHWRPAEED